MLIPVIGLVVVEVIGGGVVVEVIGGVVVVEVIGGVVAGIGGMVRLGYFSANLLLSSIHQFPGVS
jgi:hypothetical protein